MVAFTTFPLADTVKVSVAFTFVVAASTSLLGGLLLAGAAAGLAVAAPIARVQAQTAPRTFVCLSAAWCGGWIWGRVAERLRGRGHRVYTPTFTGLRLDVRGARITPAVTARLGPSVTEYRATSTNVLLSTPFPLALSDGWRASEATLASGSRVLILEFGPTLSGGAGSTLKAGTLKAVMRKPETAPVPADTTRARRMAGIIGTPHSLKR